MNEVGLCPVSTFTGKLGWNSQNRCREIHVVPKGFETGFKSIYKCFVLTLPCLRRRNHILRDKSFKRLSHLMPKVICRSFRVVTALDKPPFCLAQQFEVNSAFNIPAVVVAVIASWLAWKWFDM